MLSFYEWMKIENFSGVDQPSQPTLNLSHLSEPVQRDIKMLMDLAIKTGKPKFLNLLNVLADPNRIKEDESAKFLELYFPIDKQVDEKSKSMALQILREVNKGKFEFIVPNINEPLRKYQLFYPSGTYSQNHLFTVSNEYEGFARIEDTRIKRVIRPAMFFANRDVLKVPGIVEVKI